MMDFKEQGNKTENDNLKIIDKDIYCPKNKHPDDIFKVSAVYFSGVSPDQEEGLIPFSSKELSNRLSPPPPPEAPSQTSFIIYSVIAISFLVSIIGIPLFFIFGPVALVLGLKYYKKNKSFKDYSAFYKQAILNWNRLYYCFKDDIVFDPIKRGYAEPEGIKKLIDPKSEDPRQN